MDSYDWTRVIIFTRVKDRRMTEVSSMVRLTTTADGSCMAVAAAVTPIPGTPVYSEQLRYSSLGSFRLGVLQSSLDRDINNTHIRTLYLIHFSILFNKHTSKNMCLSRNNIGGAGDKLDGPLGHGVVHDDLP